MSKIISEFKEFAIKGNAIDMAVGVIIGASFSKIVSSLVKDILTPILSILTSGKDLSNLQFIIFEAIKDTSGNIIKPEIAIKYGMLINSIIDFLIVASCLFFVIKIINKLRSLFVKEQNKLLTEQNKLLSEQVRLLRRNK